MTALADRALTEDTCRRAAVRVNARPPDFLREDQWAVLIRRLSLSAREAEIIRLAFYDETVVTIASKLKISEHTVHTYRERLFRKLNVHSFCQVISVVFAAHLDSERGSRPTAVHLEALRINTLGASMSPVKATPCKPT